jgi:hypothetical protein
VTRASCSCALALLAACAGGSETGNPAVPTSIGLGVRSSDQAIVTLSSDGPGTVIHEAWVALGEVAFLGPDECARFGDLDVTGATLIAADLARAGVQITLEVTAQRYCGLVVPLQMRTAELPAGAPEDLADHSIVINGARADGTPFVLAHGEQDELELAPSSGEIAIERGGPDLLLAFEVATWMRSVDLDGATVGGDGVIRIDAARNAALLDAFEINLECSLELYADVDANGVVAGGDLLLASCSPD